MVSGLLGTLGMSTASAILASVASWAFLDDLAESLPAVFFFNLFYGTLFALVIGPVGGAAFGLALAVTKQTRSAPVAGALTPPAVILPVAAGLALFNDPRGADDLTAVLTLAAVLYVPFGYKAGQYFADRLGRKLPPRTTTPKDPST